ncbi:MAG: haloacid dehalogenase [Caldisphaeraceae archaeon]|nr:haloacid dehalogenase [Caldisphaeraceae archaeon]MEB3692071.1 haloacid dehalogenase [Caldisphaeraceae archaeon]MEB3797853.1 haloacid dehalogenase [Caldisphaeraceae archaeon]
MKMKRTEAKKKIEEIIDEVDSYLKTIDLAREEIVKISREVIRNSGWSITEIHKGEMIEAKKYLDLCRNFAMRLQEVAKPHPEIANSGLVYNAISEYVEAEIFFNIIEHRYIPSFKELNVHPIPYLQGIGDVIGELRRYMLELIRKGKLKPAWEFMDIMESIYLQLRNLDYPDAIIPGVRHKSDVARALIDATKSMLVDLQSREDFKKIFSEKERGKKCGGK